MAQVSNASASSLMQLPPSDAYLLLSAKAHIGSQNCGSKMQSYVYRRTAEGSHIINIQKTWSKLMLAARVIAGIENPADVVVVSSRAFGQRAVLKFAKYVGAVAVAGKFVPGTFTNCKAKSFKETRLIIVTDPREDAQAIKETAFVNAPVIAFCDTDAPLANVDIAIPCSTKSTYSIGLMWYLLAREVLHLRGVLPRSVPWSVMPDMFFYRDPEEIEKEQAATAAAAAAAKSAAMASMAVASMGAAGSADSYQNLGDASWGAAGVGAGALDAWESGVAPVSAIATIPEQTIPADEAPLGTWA